MINVKSNLCVAIYPKLSPKLAGLFFSASFSASSAKVSLLFPRVVVNLEMISALDCESTSKYTLRYICIKLSSVDKMAMILP